MKKKLLFQNGLALFVCLFLFAGGLFAQEYTHIELVTSSQNWVVPTTLNGNNIVVTSVKFEGVGGGGAGGFVKGNDSDGDNYLYQVAGGGGGGAYAATNTYTDMTPGESFAITVGGGGYNTASLVTSSEYFDDLGCGLLGLGHCTYTGFVFHWLGTSWDGWIITDATFYAYPFYKNHVDGNGGTTQVKRNGSVILSAGGGQTCAGINNITGGNGGVATVGAILANGGKGGNATGRTCGGLLGNMSTGGGGGAGNPAGIDNNGENAHCGVNDGWGHGGQGWDSGDGYPICGAGARGSSDWNDVLGGPGSGFAGENYGGGGGGAKNGTLNWHRGGPGAPGVVKVTYTYTIVPNESVEIANASTTICSGADFDVALNITADGFNLNQATVIPNSTSNTSLSVSAGTSFNTTDGKWHLTGSATNNTSNTIAFPIYVTVKTPSENDEATATVTLNIYGKLDGGVIAADQFVCQDQTIQIIKGNGDEVYSPYYEMNITTALASGGSGNGDYQWLKRDMVAGDDEFQPISGTNSPNYTPSTGFARYKRTYTDNVCGTTVTATDGLMGTYVMLTSVNELNPGNLSGTDNICTNEDFTKTLQITEFTSPATTDNMVEWNVYWQKSTDNGATWTTVASDNSNSYSQALAFTYTIDVNAGDLTTGEIQYRYALEAYYYYEGTTCTMVPCNGVYKLIVGDNAVDYTDQIADEEITLYYGECETDITDLPVPELTPTPASITRGDDGYTTVAPGEYNITWIVVPEGSCGGPQEYIQKVIVKFPECGTLEEPLTVFDEDGNEYQTIRIGCDCWFAENLKTYTENSSYYDDDAANEAFGKLYDWNDAVGSNNEELPTMLGTTYIQGICPDGWAIPTVEQFNTMVSVAGTVEDIRSDDENAWLPEEIGTNTSGFAAMGAGYFEGMQYQRLLGYTDFWTADVNESNSSVAKAMEIRIGCDDLLVVNKNKADKLSVRCVKVEPAEPEEFTCGKSTVKDVNGNSYSTVLIGEQCWTKSNLRTNKYADGTFIANTTYFIDPASFNPAYGYLYTWDAVSNTAGLCPTGWHVSTKEDWQTLGNNITSNKDIASKSGWLVSTNQNMIGYEQESTNNSTGFGAFPAGQFNTTSYQSVNRLATFWTSTESNENNAWFVSLNALMSTSWPTAAGMKTWARSVRCVRD